MDSHFSFQFWDMTKGIDYSEMEEVTVEAYKCFSNTDLSILFDFPSQTPLPVPSHWN